MNSDATIREYNDDKLLRPQREATFYMSAFGLSFSDAMQKVFESEQAPGSDYDRELRDGFQLKYGG